MRFKKTEVCQTCAKLKNVCQTCLLDLDYGKLYLGRRDKDTKTRSVFQRFIIVFVYQFCLVGKVTATTAGANNLICGPFQTTTQHLEGHFLLFANSVCVCSFMLHAMTVMIMIHSSSFPRRLTVQKKSYQCFQQVLKQKLGLWNLTLQRQSTSSILPKL